MMQGWEIKPIGVLVVLGLLILFGYTTYELLHLHQSRNESPPDAQP